MLKYKNKIILIIGYFLFLPSSSPAIWPEGGLIVANGPGNQYLERAVADQHNSAIMLWQDDSAEFSDLFLQRYDNLGNILWPAGGVRVESTNFSKFSCQLIPDGNGGFYVSWVSRAVPSIFNMPVVMTSAVSLSPGMMTLMSMMT